MYLRCGELDRTETEGGHGGKRVQLRRRCGVQQRRERHRRLLRSPQSLAGDWSAVKAARCIGSSRHGEPAQSSTVSCQEHLSLTGFQDETEIEGPQGPGLTLPQTATPVFVGMKGLASIRA